MLRKLRLKQKEWFSIKKTYTYMEQDSTKNCVVLVKTDPEADLGLLQHPR